MTALYIVLALLLALVIYLVLALLRSREECQMLEQQVFDLCGGISALSSELRDLNGGAPTEAR